MSSIVLEEILQRVKESDIESFKQKITVMEEAQEKHIHSQNLETINDIVKRKFKNQIEELDAAVYVEGQPLETKAEVPSEEVEQNSDTLYQNFLNKLKG